MIVILSIVRSNREGVIGFLKERNRVCVALSRAKHGMVIVGNADTLEASRARLWHSVLGDLRASGSLGPLALRCSKHPDNTTEVRSLW